MTSDQEDELLTEASLAIRKLQIAYPAAYQEAETALTAITALRARLEFLVQNDPYYTSHRVKQ